jgi:hypothetical protein
MKMLGGIAVKPFQGTAGFELLNITGIRKYLKIAIDRSQADTRQSFANNLVDLIRTRMVIDFAKLLQNYPALTCHPKVWVLLQTLYASS